jgi:hypothetical protein
MRTLFSALLLASLFCQAQETPPPQRPEPQAPQVPDPRRPGQEPEEQPAQRVETPVIQEPVPGELPPELPQEVESEYRGPTILSRGASPAGRTHGSELFRIHPFASIEGIYDTGLTSVSLTSEGEVPLRDAYGVLATFGVTGSHRWRRSTLALDYRGGARHYSRETYFDGSDHTLLMRWETQASRRWLVSLTQGAATFSRGFMMPYGVAQSYNEQFAIMTGNELFDTRTNALISSGQAVYQPTGRLSFGMGASGFFIRRRSQELIGANGYTAVGDMAYRLGRYSTLGVEYTFSHFDFQNQFGESDVHGLAVNYGRRIGRSWEITLRAGALRVETSRLQVVQLDPVIAEILGISQGVAIFHGVGYLPQGNIRVQRTFRRASFAAGYTRTVSPGNGLYLTARAETADAAFYSQTSRRIGLHIGTSFTNFGGLSQSLPNYRAYSGSGGVSVKVAADFALLSRFEVRKQRIPGTLLDRTSYRVSLGLGWAPRDYPVSVW